MTKQMRFSVETALALITITFFAVSIALAIRIDILGWGTKSEQILCYILLPIWWISGLVFGIMKANDLQKPKKE